MEVDDIIQVVIFTIIIFMFLWFIFIDNRLEELEDKVSGNCVYINNEFYCKD